MKKLLLLLLVLCMLCLFACKDDGAAGSVSTGKPLMVLNSMEYTLYQNYFFNKEAESHVGESMNKTGIFTTLYDSFNDCTRYYVWGYADQTKCCDWQWELVLADGQTPPANGSKVAAVGTWTASGDALDGYWLIDAEVKVQEDYTPAAVDIDMTTMSSTLARVQIQNMQSFKEQYADKTVAVYARVQAANALQHPYYDNAWVQTVSGEDLPAIGSYVTATGAMSADGVLELIKVAKD